jgi:predicted transcriptional regulator
MKRSLIEAIWRKEPRLTQDQVRRLTGASRSTVRFVYAQLVACGVLPMRPQVAGQAATWLR